ncbi:MAG: hypothetical protein HYV95_14080 [Opitutae bacterium]|nr:hypothetical protein [Opitutae bacterium]
MGLFDRFSAKKPGQPAGGPTPQVSPVPENKPAAAGGVLPQLAAARARLEAKDLPGALAIYEEVLASAGDRPDVLASLSADLGTHGHVREIIELVAPRYDAERHGASAGLNLLQAYLAVRNAEAAQHLLDLLFALGRPELEERLYGFSRAIGEIMAAEESAADHVPAGEAQIALVSISKPVWFYGLESITAHLLPAKAGRLRRVAFAQLALPDLPDALQRAERPEDALARLSRGIPLWFAETFTASAGYEAIAAIGTQSKHYAIFPMEWVADNIRQLSESADGGLDYVVTGTLRDRNDDFELSLRVWEVKKFRELKTFAARWSPATADEELARFHAQIRGYMEWTALPAGEGLAYAPPAAPQAYVLALGAALGLFLGEKDVLATEHVPAGTAALLRAAQMNPADARAQLALISALLRLKARGVAIEPESMKHACDWLATPAAQAADVSALAIKLG